MKVAFLNKVYIIHKEFLEHLSEFFSVLCYIITELILPLQKSLNLTFLAGRAWGGIPFSKVIFYVTKPLYFFKEPQI